MWLKVDEVHPKLEAHMMTKGKDRDMTGLVPTSSVEGHDHRMDQLLAKKRFFIAQNMQLQEALKMHMDNLNHVASLIHRSTQATLYDDSFLLYITRQTQVKFWAMDLRRHFSSAEHHINGISCVAVSRGALLDYDLRKTYHGLSHVMMVDLAWSMYQDRSMFLPLVNRVLDHKVVPTLNVDMTVIETTSWTLSNPNHHERRYLVVHRELSMSKEYTVTVTALSENLVPAPHAFWATPSGSSVAGSRRHSHVSANMLVIETASWTVEKQQLQRYLILQPESLANGTCSLKTGSPEETKATIEGMVHSQ
ncbi:hypothetical protein DYB37_008048 [Aphanomyces astaci]|uniref:Uncharacterized protein n=1 Tax=Aphanomyces astaci TaxID=112090 RepID=A0A3R6YAJ8_APHAT|nr:hypothetical protein DYB35_002939 [Aphanomyces astaci]RHZ07138.1 hypothetical protein DYB37_008048 [Aphanomyces astaci]